MKRLLLVAPGAGPPWTEGRKNFVRDLSSVLPDFGVDAEIIDGAPRGTGGRVDRLLAPARACAALQDRIASIPDEARVALFPYGRFTGTIGFVNRMFLRSARRICAAAGVSCVTVFYSAAGLALDALGSYAPALAVGREAARVRSIPLGISCSDRIWRERATPRRALFLCGYQDPKRSVLESVLDERGLRDLLEAGDALAAAGLKLTIAMPLLRDRVMRDRIRMVAARLCPALEVALDATTSPTDALAEHDVFFFPYRAEHAVFVPTSLLEAFSVGIPVIAADHGMYASLARGDGEVRCALHRAGDAQDLSSVTASAVANWNSAVATAAATRAWVRGTWTLSGAARVLLDSVAAAERG